MEGNTLIKTGLKKWGRSIVDFNPTDGTDILERYEYDAYGKVEIMDADFESRSVSLYDNPYLFTGRRYDDESGLYYYRHRMYNPETGRFLQTDPLGYYDSLNLYQYCGNNPINRIDPWGLKWWETALEYVSEVLGKAFGTGSESSGIVVVVKGCDISAKRRARENYEDRQLGDEGTGILQPTYYTYDPKNYNYVPVKPIDVDEDGNLDWDRDGDFDVDQDDVDLYNPNEGEIEMGGAGYNFR